MAESSSGDHSSSSLPSTSRGEISSLLRQKEHDIEIAAQIGQSLLERNRELQIRNEFLEESLAHSSEQTNQLRYELHRRIELLRYFSIDDEFGTDGDASLGRQIERLRRENQRLAAEANVLRKDLEGNGSEQRKIVQEIEGQLTAVSNQAAKLQAAISRKNEECAQHGENIHRLIEEVNKRSAREKDLSEENESLSEQLEVAVRRENELTDQMNGMQNLYAELKSMFNDAEEELRSYRSKPSPYRTPSVDSLYDSLASELETSDSGGWTPRGRRLEASAPPRSLQLPPPPSSPPPIEAEKDDDTPRNNLCLKDELASLSAASVDLPAIEEPPPPDPVDTPVVAEPVPEPAPEPVEEPKKAEEEPVPEPEPVVAAPEPEPEKEAVVVERSLLFSYDSEFSLAAPPLREKKMPEYLAEPEGSERPPSRSSSSASLSDYEAPVLGEPGVPGTRDLKASLNKKVRRQLERDFAAWRARKGLRPSAFFPEGATPEGIEAGQSILSPYLVGDARSVLPWRMCSAVGLQGVGSISGGEGVVTRAEMIPALAPSPSASPSHSAFSGLTSVISSFIPSGGIVLRRPFL